MISEIIEKWIKGILIDGITGNLSGLFDNVNAKVGEIASDVGSTPQAWNSGIFNMLRSLSETVGVGATTLMEQLIVFRKCCHYLAEKGIEVVANIVGEVLTVQEMAGFQLFIARMDDELLKYWNAPCRTPYYKN